MRARALLAVVGAFAAAASLIATAGATATTGHTSTHAAPTRADLSTLTGIKHYLRSIGVDPATVVFQRGVRNYAGPNCPGKRWNCTKATRVVQIAPNRLRSSRTLAATSASNSFECTDTTPSNNCTIMQFGPGANSARCVQKMSDADATETCNIDQTGTNNDAYVLQDISTGASSTSYPTGTQSTTQTATVSQKGLNNSLDATQDVNQTLDASALTTLTTLTQNQDDAQAIIVCQEGMPAPTDSTCAVANSGNNISKIHQSRFAKEHASGGIIVQNQDLTPDGDCDPDNVPNAPNQCALVQQQSSTSNDSDLHQEDHLQAVATGTLGANVTQKQQQPSDGIDGHVVQPVTGDAQNSSVAHQHLTDDMSAPPTATQSQDPGLGCCSPQAGTPGSHMDIHQVGILRASELGAYQQLDIFANCLSNGRCLALEHGKINGAEGSARCSDTAGEVPANCSTALECTSAGEETAASCGPPIEIDLVALGFDTLDFQNAINFVFPLTLPTSPL